jgi:hypothetical protein
MRYINPQTKKSQSAVSFSRSPSAFITFTTASVVAVVAAVAHARNCAPSLWPLLHYSAILVVKKKKLSCVNAATEEYLQVQGALIPLH